MLDSSKAQAVAGGALVAALIDVLLDRGVLTKEDGKRIAKIAGGNAALAVGSEAFGPQVADFISDIQSRIAKREG